jgi:uncharacterized repeat protein (TIGR04052 family)
MFVQDLALIRDDGTTVAIELELRAPWQSEQVALLDFEDNTGRCGEGSPEMNTEITGEVPEGTYTGLTFSNGVPAKINHTDFVTQPAPLSLYPVMNWGWLSGFRFIKAELVEVGTGLAFGQGAAHSGETACTGNPFADDVKCAKSNRTSLRFDTFDPASDTVVIDVGALFAMTNLTELALCHGTGSYCEPMFAALGIDYATGMPKSGQTVFRVE